MFKVIGFLKLYTDTPMKFIPNESLQTPKFMY